MSKKRHLVGIVFVAVAGVAGIRYWAAGRSERASAPAGVTAVERAARLQAAIQLAQLAPAPVPPQGVGRFSAELLRFTEDKFRHMVAVRGLITEDRERQALAQAILASDEGEQLVREILLNPGFAREAFGAFQAEARVYSITVLGEAARQGNVDLVVSTAGELAQQLRSVEGQPDKGRAADLIDMVTIVGDSVGSSDLLDGDSQVLAKLGFEPGLPPQVRGLYVQGLFRGVWKAEGLESAQATVERLRTL
jgi:hypothetical protein